MLNELINICEKNISISLYTNSNNLSSFIFGKVLCVNNNEIALLMISPEGEYDGILVKNVSEIIYWEIDSQYSNKMDSLYKQTSSLVSNFNFDRDKIKESVLLNAQTTKKIVSIELNYSGFDNVIGFVEKIYGNICQIKQVDYSGKDDGVAFVLMNNITQISYDSKEEQMILSKYKEQDKNKEE